MQILQTPTYKDPFSSPIDTAFINMAQLSIKTPQNINIFERPKSFTNLRKASLDYSSCKNSSNVPHFQTSIKPQFQPKTTEIYQNSQALLKHLKSLNNKSLNVDILQNKSTNLLKQRTNQMINPQKPRSTIKKFIDLDKRGSSITNVHVNVNLSSNPKQNGVSLNTSNTNMSTTSIATHHIKGKSSHYCDSGFGKELENQALYLIQELRQNNKNRTVEKEFMNTVVMQKVFSFFKALPGLDPLVIALIAELQEVLGKNETKIKENLKELENVFVKKEEAERRIEKEFVEKIEKQEKKIEDFIAIFDVLKSQGINFEEVLRKGLLKQKKQNLQESSDVYEDSGEEKQKKWGKREILFNNMVKPTEFADESVINDSEESSFNYYGKPESPLISKRLNNIPVINNKKKGVFSDVLRLNLKEIEIKRALESNTSDSQENFKENMTINKFIKKK